MCTRNTVFRNEIRHVHASRTPYLNFKPTSHWTVNLKSNVSILEAEECLHIPIVSIFQILIMFIEWILFNRNFRHDYNEIMTGDKILNGNLECLIADNDISRDITWHITWVPEQPGEHLIGRNNFSETNCNTHRRLQSNSARIELPLNWSESPRRCEQRLHKHE